MVFADWERFLLLLLFCFFVLTLGSGLGDESNAALAKDVGSKPPASSIERDTILIETENELVPATPYLVLPNGLSIRLTSDIVFDCWLVLNDLPQGSNDMINVSRVKDIRLCATLPPSFFGSYRNWSALDSFMPRFVLLNELDKERYDIFERHLAPHISSAGWLFESNIRDIRFPHLAVDTSPYMVNMFPSRRVLQTFNNWFLTSSHSGRSNWLLLSHVTPANVVDWGRIFLKERLGQMSDEEILINREVRLEIIGNLTSLFSGFKRYENFLDFFDRYITKYGELPFYERFELCVLEMDHFPFVPDDFHDIILARRNQQLYEKVFSNEDMPELIEQLFRVYIPGDVVIRRLMCRLRNWIVFGTNGQKIKPSHWAHLGLYLQNNMQLNCPGSLVLVLTGYFLGHVDLLPDFVRASYRICDFPAGGTRQDRQKFPLHILEYNLNPVRRALDTAATVDPTFRIVNRAFATAVLKSEEIFEPAAILYFTDRSEPMPVVDWMEACQFHTVRFSSTGKIGHALKKRIYEKMHLIPRQNLLVVAKVVGLESLEFVNDDDAAWLLQCALEKSFFFSQSDKVMRIVDRLFPRILPENKTSWIVPILSDKKWIWAAPEFMKHLYLLVIKHFDLASISEAKLYNLLIDYGENNTLVFVNFFKRMKEHSSFEFDIRASIQIRNMRKGLYLWLGRHFVVTFSYHQTCLITTRPHLGH